MKRSIIIFALIIIACSAFGQTSQIIRGAKNAGETLAKGATIYSPRIQQMATPRVNSNSSGLQIGAPQQVLTEKQRQSAVLTGTPPPMPSTRPSDEFLKMQLPSQKEFQILSPLEINSKSKAIRMAADSALTRMMESSLDIDSGYVFIMDIQKKLPLVLSALKRQNGSVQPFMPFLLYSVIMNEENYLAVPENGESPEDILKKHTPFVDYIPTEQPKYSIYIELYKEGKSVASDIASQLCKEVADQIISNK